jgi:hypothetical protein
MSIPMDGFKFKEVQKTVFGFLLDVSDFAHNILPPKKVIIINYIIAAVKMQLLSL